MGRPRRSSSGGSSHREVLLLLQQAGSTADPPRKKCAGGDGARDNPCAAAAQLLTALLEWRDDRGRRGTLLHRAAASRSGLASAAALLARLRQLEEMGHPEGANGRRRLREHWMTIRDSESGYTPLHTAVLRGNLASTLLLLRHAAATADGSACGRSAVLLPLPPRLPARPMDLLAGEAPSRVLAAVGGGESRHCLAAVVSAKDTEGFTAAQLLAAQQRAELAACRRAVLNRPGVTSFDPSPTTRQRQRRSSFDLDEAEENEDTPSEFVDGATPSIARYACEVFTFGRAHHGALGNGPDATASSLVSGPLRPQRVIVGSVANSVEGGGAVAVAAASHHTLVATASGRLYSFGLGKGGRLGTGDEGPRPLPARVGGPLLRRRVLSVAAAEHHSLCVTDEGQVYAWGSNGFGQLGGRSPPGPEARCLPRKVDDLSGVPCASVAAGARHSVALSRKGEVYVWGDNGSGQLATARRTGPHSVRRVDALWGTEAPHRVAIAVAASDHATLALTLPTDAGRPANAVYAWGHGNHVPARVNFSHGTGSRKGGGSSTLANNPVAIACARHHHVAVTSEGRVYTWGLHAETLGNGKVERTTGIAASSPQLVTGMLPENGGGIVVGVSASENHTAVVTDTGALYTWGASNGKNVLGHEGVRWQPDPKRVPGVYRAIGVVAAKEHTVLLVGTSFPPLPAVPKAEPTLAELASGAVAAHVDLFTAIPSLIMAERCHCGELVDYCEDFVRRNFDAVLHLGQKSVMDCYLDEQLSAGLCIDDGSDEDEHGSRDGALHPLLLEILLAGAAERPGVRRRALSDAGPWVRQCQELGERPDVKRWLARIAAGAPSAHFPSSATFDGGRPRSRSLGNRGGDEVTSLLTSQEDCGCSERCLELTENMDLSSKELVEGKQALLAKEIRWVRKRLSQISKLEESVTERQSDSISTAEQAKIARRPKLEADLLAFGPALALVEKRLKELSLQESLPAGEGLYCPKEKSLPVVNSDHSTSESKPMEGSLALRCQVCLISCPDETSYALHLSGRKHRNRLSQAENKEKASVAASIVEQKNKEQLLDRNPSIPKTTAKVASPSAWRREKGSPQPLYTLPNPPIPVPDTMVRPNSTPVRLKDIMLEESNSKRYIKHAQSPRPLSLPKGSAPPLKNPPWATTKSTVQPTPLTPKASTPIGATLALGDFITTPSTARLVRAAKAPTKPAWGGRSAQADSPSTSLQAIQDQERDFKLRQDKSFGLGDGGNRKWYVEQRERAGSMQDIQQQDEKEREMRLFVEEQFRIEQQIQEEIDAKKNAEKIAKKKPHRSPKKQSSLKCKSANVPASNAKA